MTVTGPLTCARAALAVDVAAIGTHGGQPAWQPCSPPRVDRGLPVASEFTDDADNHALTSTGPGAVLPTGVPATAPPARPADRLPTPIRGS